MIITREMGTVMQDTTMRSPVYIDVRKAPFELYGFAEDFRRVPLDVAEATSPNVVYNSGHSAGCRVRFRTDSDYIVVHGDYSVAEQHDASSGVARYGFDLYSNEDGKQIFMGIFCPSQGEGKTYKESRLKTDGKMHDYTVYFPLTTTLTGMYIGLREGKTIEPTVEKYKYETPVVFYGSSIVHGIGASRPSMNYPSVVSRRLNTNVINLGFGGSALGEPAIMEYIAGLKMSVFVYDYDHNAPDSDHLAKTHYAGYQIFRAKQPDTPIIMASKVDIDCGDYADNCRRREIVRETYEKARAAGDQNVYFIDGESIYPADLRGECTNDLCHPNDVGYQYMADAFGAIIKELLEK
ncbi:MAG: hypothetical protein IJY28_02055 [Clostridia bacterium]|nr:hypothetical protein [Clostridia bacterium]